MKKYRVYENQLKLLIETDSKKDAVQIMKLAHGNRPNKYHELYEYWDGRYNGIRQYKPGDQMKW